MKKEATLKLNLEELTCIQNIFIQSSASNKTNYQNEFETILKKVKNGISKINEEIQKEMKFEN